MHGPVKLDRSDPELSSGDGPSIQYRFSTDGRRATLSVTVRPIATAAAAAASVNGQRDQLLI